MREQLQNLGLVPSLYAIKPLGSYFSFYFCTPLGLPHITVSNSRACKEVITGGACQNIRVIKTLSSEDSKPQQTKQGRLSKTMSSNLPADRKTLEGLLHQTGTTMWQHSPFQDPHILQEKQSETYVYTRCHFPFSHR